MSNTPNYPFQISERRVHMTIGTLAILLPILVVLLSLVGQTCYYSSLSHYVYGRVTGPIFTGTLSTIALLLLVFFSSTSQSSRLDTVIARLAGASLLLVVALPTDGSGCHYSSEIALVWTTLSGSQDYPHLFPLRATDPTFNIWTTWGITNKALIYLHFYAAGVAMMLLGYFPLIAFRRNYADAGRQKRLRNKIYLVSGITVALCMFTILIHAIGFSTSKLWVDYRLTFWLETVSLTAFGLSWLTKGRFIAVLND